MLITADLEFWHCLYWQAVTSK